MYGVMIMVNGVPVALKSKYQRTFTLSTLNDEYMELNMYTQVGLWARIMMPGLIFEQKN